jgi:hypothetical protein
MRQRHRNRQPARAFAEFALRRRILTAIDDAENGILKIDDGLCFNPDVW